MVADEPSLSEVVRENQQIPESQGRPTVAARVLGVLRGEMAGVRPRMLLAGAAAGLLPAHSFGRLRSQVYRAGGLRIGRGSVISGPMTMWGTGEVAGRLRIGEDCFINFPVYVELEAEVSIGDRVAIGHGVTFVTANHRLAHAYRRAGRLEPEPIHIEDGCLVSAGVLILPGVTLGRGCVVGAGAVVTSDVEAGTLVVGVPARPVRTLSEG
jgi:acetyltransferase-like isoleucine patch superfamily enzyme